MNNDDFTILVSGGSRRHWMSMCTVWPLHSKWLEWGEQWICIKFCAKLEHSSVDTIRIIQKAFRDDAVSAAQIKWCHKCFKDGQKSVESDPHSGRPSTSRPPENVEQVWAAINKDLLLPVWELEADLEIPKTTMSWIWMQDLVASAATAEGTLWCSS